MSFIAHASGHMAAAQSFLDKLNNAIIFPLMTLLTAVALLVFLWGVFQYIYHSDDESARSTGRRHIIWGIIGLLIIVSAYSILRIGVSTIGASVP